jgi:predicted nucleotidyltransferase
MAAMSAVETLTRVLEQIPAVRLAVLFGSAARRTDRPDSDIDLAVLLEGEADSVSPLAVTLERAVGRPVDLVWLDSAPPLLRFEIAREGLVLVARDDEAWANFRAQAMIDWWDWAPTARMMHAVAAARLKEEAARRAS